MKRRFLLIWSYLVELLATASIVVLLCMFFGMKNVAHFMSETATDIATLLGVAALGASLGFLWTFYSKADTEFYRWLNGKGAFNIFLGATQYVIAISFLATACPVILKQIPNQSFAIFVAYIEILAIINIYTLVQNVIALMRLNARFNELQTHR